MSRNTSAQPGDVEGRVKSTFRAVAALRTASILLISTIVSVGCAARSSGNAASSGTLLRLATAETLTLCEAQSTRVGVSASWAGSARPDVTDLPQILWSSADASIVEIGPGGLMTGKKPGETHVFVHGRVGPAYGRATIEVTVRPGEWDQRATIQRRETVCREIGESLPR